MATQTTSLTGVELVDRHAPIQPDDHITANWRSSTEGPQLPQYNRLAADDDSGWSDDRAVSVYRATSNSIEDSDGPPPAYVGKPPPYTYPRPSPRGPPRRWVQWCGRHKKKLAAGFVVLVPAIICATIFGFMQVKAQAIINAMQFARDRPMMELEFATSADHLSFDFRDVLYNNDSRYRNIMLDEMIGTLSLKDSEPFATFHNLGDHLKKSAKYFYVSEYINVTDANVDEMAEFLRQVMTQEEVEVRMKTTEKVKMKLPGLPKYPITWDKTLYINGAGGIDTFKPGGIGSAVLFNFSGLGFVGPSRQRGNDNMTYNFQLAGTLQTPGIRGFTRELDGTYAELTDYFKKSTLALKLPKVDVDVFDENAALIGNGSFQRTVLSAEEDPGMLRALLDAAVVEELAQVAGKDGVEPVVKVWHVEPRTVRLTENWDGSGDEVVCEALTKAMEGMRIEVKVNVTEAVEAMRESDEWYEENTIWD